MIHLIETRGLAAVSTVSLRLAPADVIDVQDRKIVVSFGVQQAEAEIAILDYEPVPGDRVLVVGDDESGHFAIGVLATARPRPRLKLESSTTSGATIVSVDNGDLEIMAPRGAVRILSSNGVEAKTAGPIHFTSHVSVRMSILDRLGQTLNRMGLSRRAAELKHDQLEVSTNMLRVSAKRSHLKTDDCTADAGSLSFAARRVSANLGSLLTTVENVYQRVAGLWQLAAERTRMVVTETSHHMARRLYSKADDVKVKADKIHLG